MTVTPLIELGITGVKVTQRREHWRDALTGAKAGESLFHSVRRPRPAPVHHEIAHIEASNRAASTYNTPTSRALLALRLTLRGFPPWQDRSIRPEGRGC